MNVILNSDRTRKCVVSVSYEAWAEANPAQADPVNDLFVTNAPPIPEGMHTPRLFLDNSAWEDANPTQALLDAEAKQIEADNAIVLKALEEIDKASIRSIREWLAQQANAPQFIIDQESQAQAARSKLK